MVNKWHYKALMAILFGGGLLASAQIALADSLKEQRVRYQLAKSAWDDGQVTTAKELMSTLVTYPLYPYLKYRDLLQNIGQLQAKEVNQFIEHYPTLPLARTLKNTFINELAERQDWQGVVHFAQVAPNTMAGKCNFYYAKWVTGKKSEAYNAAGEIWLSPTILPKECDRLLEVWQKAGKQTPDMILHRLYLASGAGKNSTGLVTFLTKQVATRDKPLATAMLALRKKPENVVAFAKKYRISAVTKGVVSSTFITLARQDVDAARSAIPALVKAQKLKADERLQFEKVVAMRLFGSGISAAQAKWRDTIIAKSHDTNLIERRIRLALSDNDRKGLVRWIALLPAEAKNKDEWLYWRADGLLRQRATKAEGEKILRNLMKRRGFYPMIAAQRLNQVYPVFVAKAAEGNENLAVLPEIRRIEELLYWNLASQARSEWINLVTVSEKPKQEALAHYAFERKWADFSVQATIAGKIWDHLEERFPLAYVSDFKTALKDKTITLSYSMAIARQESAWNPQAQSPVGARGLMQLMPQTAKETAKKIAMNDYKNIQQLFDPQTNIMLGTSYLNAMYQAFGNNRILAAAAYNAGPHRVTSWLANSNKRLDAIAFVETIPFTETRGYVKSVLSYDVFYSYFLKKQSNVLTEDEWKRQY